MIRILRPDLFLIYYEVLEGTAGSLSAYLQEKAKGEFSQFIGEPLPETHVQPKGKPDFAGGDWHFSVSHSGPFFVMVFSRQVVGVDTEPVNLPLHGEVAKRYFHPLEHALPFAFAWTAKEAVGKLTGEGISAFRHIHSSRNSALLDGTVYTLLRQVEGEYLITVALPIPEPIEEK